MSNLPLMLAMLKLTEDAMQGGRLVGDIREEGASASRGPEELISNSYATVVASCSPDELKGLQLRICQAALLQLNATFETRTEA